jgi:hypothetical protein
MPAATPALSLVLHAWGDPGALPRDADRVWETIHAPLFATLERLPRLRVGLVLGGELLPYWEEKHPERIERVRALLKAGRVELLATPLYEPVLSAIPERDAVAQLVRHTVLVKRVFGTRPSGSWLPHRIWDPALPRVFERADLGWVLVDDLAILRHHPGRPDPWGVWWTERGGHAVRLFAADARVVEMLGTVPVADLLLYARGRAVQGAEVQFWAISAHDPQVEGKPWLHEFLTALAASHHLSLVPPSEAATLAPERGRTYLPSHAPGLEHHRVTFEGEHPWERHLLDHPAADRLHKKMLRVSRQLARWRSDLASGELRPDPDAEVQAERYLLRSQAADAYRPGDRPATRWRAWRDLVRAERFVLVGRRALDRPVAELADVGIRGRPQVVLRTAAGGAVIDPDRGAGVVELCFFDVSANVVDPLASVDEPLPAAFVESVSIDLAGKASAPTWTLQSVERDDDGTARCAFAGESTLGPYQLQLTKTFVLRPHATGPGAPYGTSRFDWVLDLANPGTEPIRGKVTLSVPLMVGPSLDNLDVSTMASRKETPTIGSRNASWRATEQRRSANEIADLEVGVQATFQGPATELEALLRTVGSLRFGLRRPARVTTSPVRAPLSDGTLADQGLLITFEWSIELVPRERDRLGLSLEVGA